MPERLALIASIHTSHGCATPTFGRGKTYSMATHNRPKVGVTREFDPFFVASIESSFVSRYSNTTKGTSSSVEAGHYYPTMRVPTDLDLTDCASGETVAATVEAIHREDAKAFIDSRWWKHLGETHYTAREEDDSHWEWRAIISDNQNDPYFRAVGVRTSDSQIQAAMALRVNAKSQIVPGERAVFVDRLASAPWNRDKLVIEPQFRGAGTGLIHYAIALSYSLGFRGRVNLVPIANFEFYENLGFVPTTTLKDGDVVYELPESEALKILKQRGLL